MHYYAPSSKKFEGHIASGLFTHPSIRPFIMLFDASHNLRNVHTSVLKFLIWTYEKIADMEFFFSTKLCLFPELWPFEKIWRKSCQQYISKTVEARVLKLHE